MRDEGGKEEKDDDEEEATRSVYAARLHAGFAAHHASPPVPEARFDSPTLQLHPSLAKQQLQALHLLALLRLFCFVSLQNEPHLHATSMTKSLAIQQRQQRVEKSGEQEQQQQQVRVLRSATTL